ncbi:hypothetical protein HYH02_010661 [Chlamydomonas schloesseri]|uniref:Uncharacterized protein n=1 Tax=Chlamydomonas schloesseri TaxID=2026947 RepID=A0A835TJ72_9CHLO|nr:hypothetical protein HYH02_010661 [Chlamydomonas schloesseri]|eukprot:KAG2439785.1 hypothetical protein HYH02_010661 [Chlamydomonas schloesseri]
MAAIAEIIAAIEKVEAETQEAGVAIKAVESKIEAVESVIEAVESKIKAVESDLQNQALSAEDKTALRSTLDHLRKKEQQLRTEKEQLRNKEQQLRNKEQQLRTEKEQLRNKEQQLQEQLRTERERLEEEGDALLEGFNEYIKRVRILNGPSQTSLKREQRDPSSPLVKNWRPTTAATVGLLPELAHPQFAVAVDILGGGEELDQATIDAADRLCCIGADIFDNEARLTDEVRGVLESYLEDDRAFPITSGFAVNNVKPDWSLGDASQSPSNLFLVVEVKPGLGGTGDSHYQGALYQMHFWAAEEA